MIDRLLAHNLYLHPAGKNFEYDHDSLGGKYANTT